MRFVGERALFNVWKHSAARRWRRALEAVRLRWVSSLMLLGAGFATLVLLGSLADAPSVRYVCTWLFDNEILIAVASSVYALSFVLRRRSHFVGEHSQSWLRATLSLRALRTVDVIRTCATLAGLAVVAIASFVGLVLANRLPLAEITRPIAGLFVGLIAGAACGALWPLQSRTGRREDSRFVRDVRRGASTPSLDGLSRWPIARAIAWHRPENARMLFVIAALSVPMGASAVLGLAILAVWTLGSYLVAVARAVPAVAHEASIWLRPTPLPFAAFAWAIARRAYVHQFLGVVMFAGIVVAIGGSPASVAYFASLWLVLTIMIGAIGMRRSYLSLPSSGHTMLSIMLVVAAESRARGWGLPVAFVLTLVHARGISRECT